MKPQRVMLVGAGYFARFHAEAWNRIAGVELCAVVDPVGDKARTFASQWNVPRTFDSISAALDHERPDIIDIVTRPESHLDIVSRAANGGAHVICQKPMAPTWTDCVAMCEACERAGVRLMIHENWRWQPWYREVKRLVDAGSVGNPRSISFQWRTADGNGPEPYPNQPYFRVMPRLLVHESLVHILDTFRFLFGEIALVSCRNRRLNPVIAGEDQSHIDATFVNGRTGMIDGNRLHGPIETPVAMGSLSLEGELGVMRVSPEGKLSIQYANGEDRLLPFEPDRNGYKGDSVYATQCHLMECLRSDRASESEGREYLKTVALVEACYRSNETGIGISPSAWLVSGPV
jgi:predicted dehydrogenase